MTDEAPAYLRRQLATAWSLTNIHLAGLTTDECLWRPASTGLHVHEQPDGRWRADWPEHERYDLGPSSIAWLTWHLGFWWSMVLDHSFGSGTLTREHVEWPGNANATRAWIERLHREWCAVVEQATSESLRSSEHTRWPFEGRPFGDVVAWANLELMKSAAEIGYARFLYAVQTG